jgi:hypothetical protein
MAPHLPPPPPPPAGAPVVDADLLAALAAQQAPGLLGGP